MTLAELAEHAGLTARTVRYYFEQHLLPQPEFRGTATRYGPEYLLRLRAIQAMQRDEQLGLAAIRRRLAALSPDQLERYAPAPAPRAPAPPAPAEPTAAAARIAEHAAATGDASPAPVANGDIGSAKDIGSASLEPPAREPAYAAEKWEHIALLPGLALLVRADASPLIRKIAGDIYAHCSGAQP